MSNAGIYQRFIPFNLPKVITVQWSMILYEHYTKLGMECFWPKLCCVNVCTWHWYNVNIWWLGQYWANVGMLTLAQTECPRPKLCCANVGMLTSVQPLTTLSQHQDASWERFTMMFWMTGFSESGALDRITLVRVIWSKALWVEKLGVQTDNKRLIFSYWQFHFWNCQ